MLRRVAASSLVALSLFIATPARAVDRTLDGGAHIWAGSGWGEFRAYVGPRFTWDWFSLYPYAALGPSFFNGISGTPLSIGGYGDANASMDIGDERRLIFGAGGGAGYIVGIQDMTGPLLPQAYGQITYRWGIKSVGVMAIWGPEYERAASFPRSFPARMSFSGVGFRFEYEIDNYADSGNDRDDFN